MRLAPASIVVLAATVATVALAGCGHNDYSVGLEGQMSRDIAAGSDRPVRSVACAPHLVELPPNAIKRLSCTVAFADGSSYLAAAIVQAQSDAGDRTPRTFAWDAPPPVDPATVATARPTGPAETVAATSGASLMQPGNLDAMLAKVRAHFGARDSVAAMTIFPGRVLIVMTDGEHASVAAGGQSGSFSVGPKRPFQATGQPVDLSRIDGTAVAGLVRRLSTGYGGAVARVDHLALRPGTASGAAPSWDIYVGRGTKPYRATLTGGALHRVAS